MDNAFIEISYHLVYGEERNEITVVIKLDPVSLDHLHPSTPRALPDWSNLDVDIGVYCSQSV